MRNKMMPAMRLRREGRIIPNPEFSKTLLLLA